MRVWQWMNCAWVRESVRARVCVFECVCECLCVMIVRTGTYDASGEQPLKDNQHLLEDLLSNLLEYCKHVLIHYISHLNSRETLLTTIPWWGSCSRYQIRHLKMNVYSRFAILASESHASTGNITQFHQRTCTSVAVEVGCLIRFHCNGESYQKTPSICASLYSSPPPYLTAYRFSHSLMSYRSSNSFLRFFLPKEG